ncbi:hypothetical protein CR513_54389, partial [Mucuna pruriens]
MINEQGCGGHYEGRLILCAFKKPNGLEKKLRI